MPLDVGHEWTYIVKAPRSFLSYVTKVKVARRLSVADTAGVELASDLGPSRLAWKGNELLAERLIGTQFAPALPLVFSSGETYERPWSGRVTFVDRGSFATASESQKGNDDLTFEGRRIHCIESTIELKTAAHRIELLTWFSEGLGIVQQEQRTDGVLVLQIRQLER
ncbi:MAG TPA: hypothetical protein VMI31_00895 [Fimbriimonadaceae bacterium]|nr:hypothetical protein [Fimbriimonadaceae bacterium]